MASVLLSPAQLMEKIPGLDAVEPCFDRGGFKSVYQARVQDRKEALKVIEMRTILDPNTDPEIAEAFLKEQNSRIRREVKALGECQIPEIVRLGAIPPQEFEIDAIHYFAYTEEFVDGIDLWKIIRGRQEIPQLPELITLFSSLLHCVQELWRHGYVHRDIKPHNVMRTEDATRKFILLDLGIAYAVNETSLTYNAADRMPPATYRYLAPEMLQTNFRDRIDYRTDLYTTGMTVYEYAAGRHPLAKDEDDLMLTISRAIRQPPTPLRQHRPDLPIGFCELVDGMLKKKPALRPANIQILLNKLKGIL